MFDSLDMPEGFTVTYNPVSIRLVAHNFGLSISGDSKGYAYMDVQPELLVEDLDKYKPAHRHSYTAYRSLGEHWYLYYQFED